MNVDTINNIYQLLAIVIPSLISAAATYFSVKNSSKLDKNTQITTETKNEVKNVNNNQKNIHELINSRQTELIDIVRKSAFAEGIIEGLKRDQTFTANGILMELKNKGIVKKEQEDQANVIIKLAVETKDKLLQDALLAKVKLEQDMNEIKDRLIHELNQKLINEK